jgi:ABC-2 type transport system ATP-binding protein
MDDLAALCSEVTILAAGRVVFAGPVEKLATEGGDLDYLVLTSDPRAARQVAAGVPGLRLVEPDGRPRRADALVVRGGVPALDRLVVALVGAGVAVRELAPVVPPLEAAFLALTGLDATSEEAR